MKPKGPISSTRRELAKEIELLENDRERLRSAVRNLQARIDYYQATLVVDYRQFLAVSCGSEVAEVPAIAPERLDAILRERQALRDEVKRLRAGGAR